MGSFKAGGSDKGPDRRRGKHQANRKGFPRLEWLEGRLLLASNAAVGGNPVWQPTSDNPADIQNGPMANLGGDLATLYVHSKAGESAAQLSQEFPLLQIKNDSVMVGLTTWGDLSTLRSSVVNLGMQITTQDATYGLIDGWMPINQLLNTAQLPQLVSGHPDYKPVTKATTYQGTAHNEALQSLQADTARTQYNVNGAGVGIGVLSDSFNALGGYAADVASGDLPGNVKVIADDPTGTDEGRAMLQNIYDIAPGSSLSFAAVGLSDASMAANIKALAAAGSNIIVDDVGFYDEPFFQDGIISQAINTVTAQGVTYLSAAGNAANHGYLSTFRGAQATVGAVGAGTFMNFNPGVGAGVFQLPITTTAANAIIGFQFDQPFATQQPVGSTNKVTSQLNFYVLDANGAIVAQGTNDNTATQEPLQRVSIPDAGSYTVAIQLVKGTAPGHVQFLQLGDTDLTVSSQFGAAGGTFYPTTYGHSAAANTIGVGATPWWSPTPFLGQNPLANEPFSSNGPTLIVRNPDGSPMRTPQTVLNPTITAPDGGNTTFFGQVIQTNNPSFPGQPATTTNLSQDLPSFFGTSSAAPNAAAVAALMKQKSPSITSAQVKAGLIASATPMNNFPTGQWSVQSGYGLVNAVKAVAAVNALTVVSTNPPTGAVVQTLPSQIVVTFSKPVLFSTVNSSDIEFVGLPAGSTINFGAPVALDDPNFPTQVAFPFSYTKPPGVSANGPYWYHVIGPITAKDGSAFQQSGGLSFNLQDNIAPTVVSATPLGRLVTIQFSEAMDPSTITKTNLTVLRAGNTVNLNDDPRVILTYNPNTFTATLDYSALPQTAMPSDTYVILVRSGAGGVTDAAGNQLDGNFNGTFPSGDGAVGGDFIDNLGYQVLQAPVVTTFQITPASDSGVAGDKNTNVNTPTFIGQVYNTFPGTISNLQLLVEFDSLHGGALDLNVGSGGRGFTGSYDVAVSTDANGKFTFTAPYLPEGFQRSRALVIGQVDSPPLPGYTSTTDRSFRIDNFSPQITSAYLPDGTQLYNNINLNSLESLSLFAQDPSLPSTGPLATPSQVVFPALDPSTATNISNYSLYRLGSTGNVDYSQYIISAAYVSLPSTTVGGAISAYVGRIDLKLAPGLPAGNYQLAAHTTESWGSRSFPGLRDAAGNALNDTTVPGQPLPSYYLYFSLQPSPAYITNMAMTSSADQASYETVGGPGSYYDLGGGRANLPPGAWMFDVSNPLPYSYSNGIPVDYSKDVELVRSADNAAAPADGNFGTLGQSGLADTGTGFTKVSGTTVALYWFNPATGQWIASDASHPVGTRLVMSAPAGGLTKADYYRVYIPNQITPSATDTRIFDIYGNQLDGEFLGNATGAVSTQFHSFSTDPSRQFPGARNIYNYEDLLSTGYATATTSSRMTGDGVAGGAYMTGFVVATTDHILYARPDYQEDPLNPSTAPDGSLAKPYSTLAPEGDPNTAPANPTHDPNGGLNSNQFALSGFNPNYDRNGNGRFDRSVLYAASQLAYTGPVVAIALPGTPQRNPVTGVISQLPFVLQAPAGSASYNNGSASVPFDTTLVFTAGSTLKSQNASLFVQNQGSALQIQGGATAGQQVNFTSYNDASIGGPTNNNPDTTPRAGDWGGVVFRNYNEAITSHRQAFPVDGILQGINGPAVAGADELMSRLNFLNLRYAGGAVPQSSSDFYNGITLYNTRPAITNTQVTDTGSTGGTQAAIGADLDSFLDNDISRGAIIRRVTVRNNSLNGLWILSQNNGFIQTTDATPMPDNPSTLGGSQNYAFFQPLPIIVLAQLVIGQEYNVNTGGNTNFITNRLYVDSGSMLKFNRGSSIAVLNPGASINVGSRDYITKFDLDNNYGPGSANFKALSANDPQVLFTSLFDDKVTTSLVPTPINVTGETTQPTLGASMWGSIGIQSGALAVINAATFVYGGGSVNTQQFTLPSQSVLSFITSQTFFNTPFRGNRLGTRVYVTNNNFYGNFDAAMQIEPDGLLAGDTLHPLVSGHPFLRGNVMQGNGIDGLAVLANRTYLLDAGKGYAYVGPRESNLSPYSGGNQSVDALWDLTDITYVVRGTIVLAGAYDGGGAAPVPNANGYTTPPAPSTSLTIQAALPGTLLADGTVIPSPGAQVVVKLLSENTVNAAGDLSTYGSTGSGASVHGGAGFIVGVDDAVDPTPSPTVDPGAYAQIRIIGIPGNQTTGQQRVPVVITSLRDTTVGTTARGVKNYTILNSYPVGAFIGYGGQSLTTPKAGDGGYIYIGGNSLTTYDLTDPRQGSLIDNANISYLTSIQVQGGGIVDEGAGLATNWLGTKSGYGSSFIGPAVADPLIQLNARMAVRISDSNLNAFSSAAIFAHPTNAQALVRLITAQGASRPIRSTDSGTKGQAVTLYLYNNTISNSAEGVHVNSETGNNDVGQSPFELVSLNNTFYNNPLAIHTVAPAYNGLNSQSHVYTMAMNNIIDQSSNTGILIEGDAGESQLEYNLFFGNGVNVTANGSFFTGNINAVYGNPLFVDAANLNFALSPGSAAIDASRSEIGPNPSGDAIYPTVTQPSDGSFYGPRTDPTSLFFPNTPGASNLRGGFGNVNDPRKILTLPGSNGFGFKDEWIPVLATAGNATNGPSYVPGAYYFAPIQGQRDALGYIRIDDPATANTGFGRSPFQDIGAIEYVNLHPPEVTAVQAVLAGPSGYYLQNFYTVGGKSGANVTPSWIAVNFSSPISPDSINANTVMLEALGVTGANAPGSLISLAGKLRYDTANQVLFISLGASGLTLPTDAYRLVLVGSGSQVIFNPQGIALDGENLTNNNDPVTGVQLPLPSGNGYPGGNFYNNFIINTVPSTINPGSFLLSPASDSNVVGDLVTNVTTPSFEGTITEPNTALVPLAGQTAVIDVGVAWPDANGNLVTYYDAATAPAWAQPYLRPNAGTGVTDAAGKFSVTVGQDAANTGLVTNTNPLLSSPYNVGASGNLIPIPGDTLGYYVVRVRVIDQSGNQSAPATTPVVVDTGDAASAGLPLQAAITNPKSNAVVSNPGSNFAFQVETNKNLDLTHFTATQITLVQAGPDGTFATGTVISINPASITVKYLDATANGGAGGKGRELISFQAASALANGLYSLTITGTGSDGIRDIAGNLLGSDLTTQFAVYNPAAVHGVFVGGAGYVTDPTAAAGLRANPYPTIGAAIAAAAVGDRIEVLPGVYAENVVMRQLVSLASASPQSTDTTFVPGDALQTIIRAPYVAAGVLPAVSANGLTSFVDASSGAALQTTITGFSIASALVGDPALGPINSNSVGLSTFNSQMLISGNYFVDSGFGIAVYTSADGPLTSTINNNGIIGNTTGLILFDQGGTPTSSTELVVNNTFAYNTIAVNAVNSTSTGTGQAYLANNIFWQNHDQTTARGGIAIYSATPNHLVLNNNMFSGNGPSDTNNNGVSWNVGNGFNPAALGTTAASALANGGNYVGFPAFVTPIDPRPGSDGPATFYLSANFGLSGSSAATNNALESVATKTDFLGNAQNPNPTTKGFGLPGYGPRDVGAFEYVPVGSAATTAVGGSFRVVTTSLVPDGGSKANGGTLSVASAPNVVVVSFSNDLDPASVKANALSISGSGVSSSSPVVSTAARMVDSHTVAFTLGGKFNASGDVNVSVPSGSLKNKSGQNVGGYSDRVYLNTVPVVTTPVSSTPVVTTPIVTTPIGTTPVVTTPVTPVTPPPASSPATPVTPPPASAPTTVVGGKTPTRKPTPVKNNPAAGRQAAAAKQAAARQAAAAQKAAQKAARIPVVKTPRAAIVRRTPPAFAARG